MSFYCSFYREMFVGGSWRCEPCAANRRLNDFLSVKNKQAEYGPLSSLFFAPNALIPFNEGLPPDPTPSELCLSLMQFDGTIAWLPTESLFLGDWEAEQVLVTGRVKTHWASLFSNGLSPFPVEALLQAGMALEDVQRLRCGTMTERRVSRVWGGGLHDLRNAAGDDTVAVTWMDSIAGFVGPSTALAFRSLERHGQQTRVIVCTA